MPSRKKNLYKGCFKSSLEGRVDRVSGANLFGKKEKASIKDKVFGSVVQLVRMPPCHGGGRGFESRPVRKEKIKSQQMPANIRFAGFLFGEYSPNYLENSIFK
ncbi:MAG: hypothetical protein JWP81_5107 [Ferruginibacter sp.]|nr:hypothetical protein [Ferruginibacter sp.]